MRCHECDNGFECCHEVSLRHADGTTECLGEAAGACTLPHELHVWAEDCTLAWCPCDLALVDGVDALPLAA